jgi:hypothetical protein
VPQRAPPSTNEGSTLTLLTMRGVGLWRTADSAAAAAVVLAALTAHPSLRELHVSANACAPALAHVAGAALGALGAANAPSLSALVMHYCALLDAGLAPLVAALPANTHLRALDCEGNHMSDACVRHRLLPAVRANASLTQLHMSVVFDGVVRRHHATAHA